MKLDTILRKVTLIALVILVVIVLGLGLLFNFVISPEKLTPAVVKELNKQLNATVDCDRIDLTFFSTFPNVGARITNAYIKTINTGEVKDTLASFHSALVTFNFFQYLLHEDIIIKKLQIKNPDIYVYIGKYGLTNMKLLKSDSLTNAVFVDKSSIKIRNIRLKKLDIIDANLIFEDGVSELVYNVDSFSLKMKTKKEDDQTQFRFSSYNKDVKVFSKGKKMYIFNSIGSDFDIDYNNRSGDLRLKSNDIKVDDIHFSTQGIFTLNKSDQTIDVLLQSSLKSNSIKSFISVVPERFLPKSNRQVNGEVLLNVIIDGIYGKGSLPNIKFDVKIKDGHLAYSDYPGEIRILEGNMRGQIIPDSMNASYFYIDKLKIKGNGININGDIKLDGFLDKKHAKANLKGNIDFSKIAEDFPLDSLYKLEGKASMDFTSDFYLQQLNSEGCNIINIAGDLNLDHVSLESLKDTLKFATNKLGIRCYNNQNDKSETFAELKINRIQFDYKNNISFHADEMEAIGRIHPSSYNQLMIKTTAYAHNIEGRSLADTTAFILKKANIHSVFSKEGNNGNPQLISDFLIDSIGLAHGKRKFVIQQGSCDMKINEEQHGKWNTNGNVNFKSLIAIIPDVPEPVIMASTTLSFVNDNLEIDNAKLIYGDSDLSFSGNVEHTKGLLTGNLVKADLKASSYYVNADELITSLFGSSKDEIQDDKAHLEENNLDKDNTVSKENFPIQNHTFPIADSLQLHLMTHFDSLKFERSIYKNVDGLLTVRDGNLNMEHFKLSTPPSELQADWHNNLNNRDSTNVDIGLIFQP